MRRFPVARHRVAPTLAIAVCLSAQMLPASEARLTEVLRNTCVGCHGQHGAPSGNVDLTRLASAKDLAHDPELLKKLARALDSGFMPPQGTASLDEDTRRVLVAQLRLLLAEAVRDQATVPQAPIRRMTRFQYNNAVQDLFELQVDVFALPERMLREYDEYFQPGSGEMPVELKAGSRPLGKSQLIGKRLAGVAPYPQDLRAEHGFDNRGDHLTLSPMLLESFFNLSQSILGSADFNASTSEAWFGLFEAPLDAKDIESNVRVTLKAFLEQAFRGPVEEALLDRYVEYALARIEATGSYTEGMKAGASAVLASPRFLYLYDRASGTDRVEAVDDFDLASRLSFFLWGSVPDRTLFDLAAEGRLHESDVLAAQVDRMLADTRVKRFCDSFPTQWLQLERIVSSLPDEDLFPDFYFARFRASMHMMMEPLLLFETVLVEDRSILDLVDPGFSYRSELLESWYRDGTRPQKVPPVAVPFRRVAVHDRRQGGVITNAAVMTMTSGPRETKPITRGAWIASVIFNDPPDPPPANVPELPKKDLAADGHGASFRERFAAHRTLPECVSCHVKIDPLGFALENYGPTGVWRDTYPHGEEVDASGVLFGRHEFTDIVEFKDALLAEKDLFARAFAEHLLEFALGREIDASDEPSLDRIVRESSQKGYRIREMIKQITLSEPFRRKYNPSSSG